MLEYMYITNDPDEAKLLSKEKGLRFFIDLEINGKKERQLNRDTHISNHNLSDIDKIKNAAGDNPVMVRINPLNACSRQEIEDCIKRGADIIMLPMFSSENELKQLIELVRGRVKICPLIETPQALCRIDDILMFDEIAEYHIGINDLHLGLGVDFMFELVSDGIIEYLASKLKFHGKRFGFGGVARVGKGVVPPEVVIGSHYEIGSQMVILSRSFRNNLPKENLIEELHKLRKIEEKIEAWNANDFLKNKLRLKQIVKEKVLEGTQY